MTTGVGKELQPSAVLKICRPADQLIFNDLYSLQQIKLFEYVQRMCGYFSGRIFPNFQLTFLKPS